MASYWFCPQRVHNHQFFVFLLALQKVVRQSWFDPVQRLFCLIRTFQRLKEQGSSFEMTALTPFLNGFTYVSFSHYTHLIVNYLEFPVTPCWVVPLITMLVLLDCFPFLSELTPLNPKLLFQGVSLSRKLSDFCSSIWLLLCAFVAFTKLYRKHVLGSTSQ